MAKQCELLDLPRSSYYYRPKTKSREELAQINLVDETYTQYPFFGTRKMAAYLARQGYLLGRKKIRKIYELLGLEAIYPKPNLSRAAKANQVYPYLLKDLAVTSCNQVWSTDITYIRLKGGFVYLMAIMDWHSRLVLDWELSISLDAGFCVAALQRLLKINTCEIFNSDQGSQFTSQEFINSLLRKEIKISMDSKGRCLDNVFVERLWRSLKYECIYLLSLETVAEARAAINNYFSFYNHIRPHQSLANKTPAEVYFGEGSQC